MKKTLKLITVITLIFFGSTILAQNATKEFTTSIENKHKKDIFFSKKYISYDVAIVFGGKPYLEGNFTQETGGGKIKLTKKDGSIIVFDGIQVYGKGIADKNKGKARFNIFTWPYFLGAPYKLNDGGTKWSDFTNQKWNNESLETGKLSFEPETGDAPDDWYVIYKNKENILVGAAYIVSFGKGKEAAEKEPHAIKYNNFTDVSGIPFSTDWSFHLWNLEEGYTDLIGEVKLSNIKFLNEADFTIPEGSNLIESPKK